jgi:hypothetical protein
MVRDRSPAVVRSRARLAAMKTRPVHPLALYLLERGIGIGEGARLLCVSVRALREVLSGRARFVEWRESGIASDLGMAVETLFPRQ